MMRLTLLCLEHSIGAQSASTLDVMCRISSSGRSCFLRLFDGKMAFFHPIWMAFSHERPAHFCRIRDRLQMLPVSPPDCTSHLVNNPVRE
jgi:hypothetical protein